MTKSGLSIAALEFALRNLGEGAPDGEAVSGAFCSALANDALLLLGSDPLPSELGKKIADACSSKEGEKKIALFALALSAIAGPNCRAHFAASAEPPAFALDTLLSRFGELAPLHERRWFVGEGSGREEFARTLMRAFSLLPEGETDAQAEDRFAAVDSVERRRVVRKAMEAQRRAEEIRRAIEARAAEEASSKMSRE